MSTACAGQLLTFLTYSLTWGSGLSQVVQHEIQTADSEVDVLGEIPFMAISALDIVANKRGPSEWSVASCVHS